MSSTVAPATGLTAAANLSSLATVARYDHTPTPGAGTFTTEVPSALVCVGVPTGTQRTLSLDCSILTVRPAAIGSTAVVTERGVWGGTPPPPLRVMLLSDRIRTGSPITLR